jgi:iron complex outermembrane receptor protein
MKQFAALMLLLFALNIAHAQQESNGDSTTILKEVVVRGFENNSRLLDVPASINLLRSADLNRYNNSSLVSAMNIFPGVRMEERSPGSYRLNLRGSSLRSPFGVRNVKVYYNDIPYTDAGGNTYLNVLGFHNVQSIEIVKGPAGSLYGAGTGGALLINNTVSGAGPALTAGFTAGSFGLRSYLISAQAGDSSFMNRVSYQQQKANGYRDHTELNRKVFTWDTKARLSNGSVLQTHLLYGDLFYETPGGLTAAEYAADPKQARPKGAFPSPQEAKAAIYTKLFLAGIGYTQQLSAHWKLSGSMYGAFSELKNPTIRNYERKTEPNAGGRAMITGSWLTAPGRLNWNTGVELQKGFGTVRVATNVDGQPDSVLTDDELSQFQYFVFTQLDLSLNHGWYIAAGLSSNQSKLNFSRISDTSQERSFSSVIAPRFAVSKEISRNIAVYGTISKGFSPPSSAELLPSTGILSTNLEAETGYNYELGFKGSIFNNRLFFDINSFYFKLDNTIVQRRDSSNADYFVNAGSTNQYGVEAFFQWRLIDAPNRFINSMMLYGSYTYSDFKYHEYVKDTINYAGNSIPSVTPHATSMGIDINFKPGLYSRFTYYYNDPIPLNDANTAYGSSFNLFGGRIGYRKKFGRNAIDLFFSADNLFDVKYSLGNDINAAGGRYYNAAPGRNYAAGIVLHIND